jgi:hypothetical protein
MASRSSLNWLLPVSSSHFILWAWLVIIQTLALIDPVDYFHCPIALLRSFFRDLRLCIHWHQFIRTWNTRFVTTWLVLHFMFPTPTLTSPWHIFALPDLECGPQKVSTEGNVGWFGLATSFVTTWLVLHFTVLTLFQLWIWHRRGTFSRFRPRMRVSKSE